LKMANKIIKPAKDFIDLIKCFNKQNVEYCICGAYSVMYYSRPRYTNDLDVLIKPTEENIEKTLSALTQFHGAPVTNTDTKELIYKKQYFEFGVPPVMVHVMTQIDGVEEKEVWNNLEKGKFGNIETYYIGINELKKNKDVCSKKPTRSNQDKVDLQMLENSVKSK